MISLYQLFRHFHLTWPYINIDSKKCTFVSRPGPTLNVNEKKFLLRRVSKPGWRLPQFRLTLINYKSTVIWIICTFLLVIYNIIYNTRAIIIIISMLLYHFMWGRRYIFSSSTLSAVISYSLFSYLHPLSHNPSIFFKVYLFPSFFIFP